MRRIKASHLKLVLLLHVAWGHESYGSLLFRPEEISAVKKSRGAEGLSDNTLSHAVHLDAIYYTPQGPRIWVNGALVKGEVLPGVKVINTNGSKVTFCCQANGEKKSFTLRPGQSYAWDQ